MQNLHNLSTNITSCEAFLVLSLDRPLTNLVNQEGNGCDKRRVRLLSRSCHLRQCGEKGDAIRAVHFTQPGLKPLLVLWVWTWTHAVMIIAANNMHRLRTIAVNCAEGIDDVL